MQTYLHISTQSILIQTCENVLIKHHLLPVQDEFQNLLDQDKIEDLTRMYGLLSRVPEGLDKLRTIFESHVKKQGLNAVEKVAEAEPATKEANEDGEDGDENPAAAARNAGPKKPAVGAASAENVDPKVYVDALLMVHKKYSELVNGSFRGESGFVASLDKACREFVNRNQVCRANSNKSPEMLARFCDALLRKSSKVTEEGEVDDVLNSIVKNERGGWRVLFGKFSSHPFPPLPLHSSFFSFFLDDCLQIRRGQGCFPKVLQQVFVETPRQ